MNYSLFEDVLRLDGLMLRERLACELASPSVASAVVQGQGGSAFRLRRCVYEPLRELKTQVVRLVLLERCSCKQTSV